MKGKYVILVFALSCLFLISCKNSASKTEQGDADSPELVSKVITADEQSAMTPDEVISMLMQGNERYMQNKLTARDLPAQIMESEHGQYPMAIVLACVDSRVPVEYIFDCGVGDIFVARVAGNFVNKDILGSMEYACKVSGSKLILVLGHEHCGAVKAAVDHVELGNITEMLKKIEPALLEHADYTGEKSSKNGEFVEMVCESNVENTMEDIRVQSPILKELEENGTIKIIGGLYSLKDGKVTLLEH